MSLIQAIVLGAVQGVTEFLPISSTAHLVLVPWFLGWKDPGSTFDIALHFGTLIALLLYFRTEWVRLVTGGLKLLSGKTKDPDARLAGFIVLATIPAGIAGLLLEDYADAHLRNPLVIAAMLILLALALVVAEKLARHKTEIQNITIFDALTVGCAQALALVPGVSRSGVTMTAGLFRGMTREAAARFSFFLSTPIIGAAVLLKTLHLAKEGVPSGDTVPMLVGVLVSGIVGYLSIAFLLRYLATHTTYLFIYYRIALGLLILATLR
jgi:undecaprenyl-diphosphatase